MKYKTKKGEEVEIEETEVIKTIQEEYEKKLQAKDEEIKGIKTTHEKEKEELRKEHVKQLRTILTGKKETKEKEEFEEEEVDEEEKLLKEAREHYKNLTR